MRTLDEKTLRWCAKKVAAAHRGVKPRTDAWRAFDQLYTDIMAELIRIGDAEERRVTRSRRERDR